MLTLRLHKTRDISPRHRANYLAGCDTLTMETEMEQAQQWAWGVCVLVICKQKCVYSPSCWGTARTTHSCYTAPNIVPSSYHRNQYPIVDYYRFRFVLMIHLLPLLVRSSSCSVPMVSPPPPPPLNLCVVDDDHGSTQTAPLCIWDFPAV